MKSDIARQPLVPAFLTLLVLGGATAWSFAFADTSAAVVAADPAVGGLVLDMPARVVVDFQAARPGWARLLATLAFMLAALATGRMTLRHGLYGVSTCLAVPLAGLFMLGLLQGAGSLAVTTGALLLAYSTKNFARSFRNGYAFDALLRGGGYLGLLVVLFPATLPLAALLPFACLLFRRTLREAAVALFGAVLPLLLFAYVNWGAGGRFAAPFEALGGVFVGDYLAALRGMSLAAWFFAAFLALLDAAAVAALLRNLYGVGTQPRFILVYNIGVLALVVLLFAGPAASPALLPLAAVPSAVLAPVLFVRVRPALATLLYAVSFALAALHVALQYAI
ncbi:hypothetical protein [Alistipes sp.]|uniref:hypothetical protein n=1 Tax=Alistipes sp. TaxID=1872444 RepID=UPI000E9FA780|nr:hypothetical protein [Alistipes sp.]HBX90546.1 hypothetical protein [Alistipes sp.]HCN13420.1 hypothetical protein [Alistipes sp.]